MARRVLKLGGLSNSLSETVEAEGAAYVAVNCLTDNGIIEGSKRYNRIGQRSSYSASDVGYGVGYGKWTGNEIQRVQITGGPTGGTFKLTIVIGGNTYSSASTCAYNATPAEFYNYLQQLANGGTKAFNPDDLIVTGSQFPTGIMEVEFVGRYANTDMALFVLATNSLTGGSSPSVTITEKRKGGDFEIYYAVVKHSGDTDSNLYAVTSSDGFVTTTWTSLATDFDSSDWFFEQYFDKMFMANATDGLKYVYIGTSTIAAAPPKPGTSAPEFTIAGSTAYMVWGSPTTYAQTGFATAPTISSLGNGMRVVLNGTEDGSSVVITATLSASVDYSASDIFELHWNGSIVIETDTMILKFINNDGSPATISAVAISPTFNVSGTISYYRYYHFAGDLRYLRDNVLKYRLSFDIAEGVAGNALAVYGFVGTNWMNDTKALNMGSRPDTPPTPTLAAIDYMYTFYRTSDGAESAMSPIATSPTIPTSEWWGRYLTIGTMPSSELSGSDRVFFYRREKGTGKWRRMPNNTTDQVLQIDDYGAANSGPPTQQDDHRMEYELSSLPEYVQTGFPPTTTGQKANQLAVWKQCLCIASGKLAYLSWVGIPERFEPSPDTAGYIAPDPDLNPDVGETSYVSDNRAENVYGLHGQDTLYAATPLSCYAKIGDSPAGSTVFRRLPGSRGTLGYRSSRRYGPGIVVMSQDGFWFYSVGRGFSGEDNGALQEREETREVRRSYQRLISPCYKLEFTGADDATYSITVTEGADTYETPSVTSNWKAHEVQKALEVILGKGNVEVMGDREAGHLFFRLIGRFANGTATLAATAGAGLSITSSTIASGGGTSAIVAEHEDEYWLFNGKQFMSNARNRGWVEGIFNDSVKAAVVDRSRGLIFQDSTGRLHRIKTGFSTDNGEPAWFEYQTPWLTGDRSRITAIGGVFSGAPTVRILSDDGRAGVRVKDVALQEDRFNNFNSGQLPGLRHKVQIFGLAGRDEIQKMWVEIEDAGGDAGS